MFPKFKGKTMLLGIFLLAVALGGCQSGKNTKTLQPGQDFTNQLGPGADQQTLASYLFKVRRAHGITRALALHYPELSLDEAYKIQMKVLSLFERQGEKLAGWKMGGSRVTDPARPFQPVFGFMPASGGFYSGDTASCSHFVPGYPLVEAEVGFVFKKDLPGPVVTRQEVIDAIDSVGGFSELISIRVRDAQGGIKAALPLMIADGLSNGGFIQPKHKLALGEVDLTDVQASVAVNGQVKATGDSRGFRFFDALTYLANQLPKYGRHLCAGDIVITGSLLKPPPVKPGDRVEIKFSAFEPLTLTFK